MAITHGAPAAARRIADVRYRRPWLLEVDYHGGRHGAHCYVCELGGWWWNPGRRTRFLEQHRRCGFAEWGSYQVPDLRDLRPPWDREELEELEKREAGAAR